ncbi:unnamed protein product [Aureobasidium mustum]|uniref:Helicase ATP-binding domain-containing protein n=1 Tax=Aureobasidium mustum TaxID=2773714 RepID=A0A9N8PHP2_9PEZI|nr:unnamed protein product [Aureobasidium mustum]
MAKRRRNSDAAYAADSRASKKKTPSSTQPKSSAPLEEAPLTTRRSTRATKRLDYSDHTAYADIGDSNEEIEQQPEETSDIEEGSYTKSEDEQSASSIMSSTQSLSSDEPASEPESVDEPSRKKVKANSGHARKPAKSTPESTARNKSTQEANTSEQQEKPSMSKGNMLNLTTGKDRDIDVTLPPLSNIHSIFDDMVEKGFAKLSLPIDPEEPKKQNSRSKPPSVKANKDAPKYSLEDVCKHIGSRPLRVATMCSGTESPLLALDMISDCIRKREGSLELRYEHVFSAEIVPFKQAYIERNFSPPIIFRDITDITRGKDGKAITAYGGEVDIPGNVDLVIAGTACVDFSRLNNKRKTLQERGESGDTFAAVLAYAVRYRPTMLVLENVYGAPWDEMLREYRSNGYISAGVLVDSKHYYLPQTRQRGYMVCIDEKKLDACSIDHAVFREDFQDRMADFKRPASSPLSSFILPNDDPLVTRASQSMARQSELDSSLREVDWAVCEIGHINYRRENELGTARPLTDWQESGTLKLPEYCNRLWFGKQVERVWDFIDMSQLRKVNKTKSTSNQRSVTGYDPQYKTRIWDVSQNIHRFTDGAPFGIAPCLTPSGIFYITDRGGPLTYTESLMLQGLPLDRISFTTETERQIQDLAGNAMSTTVVGSAIASALLAGFKTLPQASAHLTSSKRAAFESVITSRDRLVPQPAPQTMVEGIDIHELCADACKSAAMCGCEGQISVSEKAIQTCSECGHTSCLTCGVKPSHQYGEPSEPERDEPDNFIQKWRSCIPMVLRFRSSKNLIMRIKESVNISEPSASDDEAMKQRELKQRYLNAVENIFSDPFTFKGFRRTSSWVVTYESSSFARLELVLGAHGCMWKLYAKPDDKLSGDDQIRKFFQEPVATAQVEEDAFFGVDWRWRMLQESHESSIELLIQGQGQSVPSWAARLGLPRHAEEEVWSELRIAKRSTNHLSNYNEAVYKQIQGTYKLLRDCGTAGESLYKRIEPTEASNMFLFLDPAPIGNPKDDCFVFARDHSKLQHDQFREITASVDAAWRPEAQSQTQSSLKILLNGHWITEGSCLLEEANVETTISSDLSNLTTDCSATKALVSLNFVLPSSMPMKLYEGQQRIRPDDEAFFAAFGWAMEPLRQIVGQQGAQDPLANSDCEECAPSFPEICWRVIEKSRGGCEFIPYEDSTTARKYENAIKSRPEPFVIEFSMQERSVTIDVGLSTTTLCHRAAGKLRMLTNSVDFVSWNLDTSWVEEPCAKFPPFTLLNNSDNVTHDTSLGWSNVIKLYDIQKRSLTWMKHQEQGIGPSFLVKEVEEALLPHLGWRLESEASTEVHVKGGILADHAGFGKTVTSLALIHSEFHERGAGAIVQDMQDISADDALIDIAATLIICPTKLVQQWADEVRRLLAYNDEELVTIVKVNDLKKKNLEVFKQAKIVIMDKNVLGEKSKYLEQLAMFAAMPEYTGKSTRGLRSYLRDAVSRIPGHLRIRERLRTRVNGNFGKLQTHLQEAYSEILKDPKYRQYAEESKRLKGKAYANKKKKTANVSNTASEDFDVFQYRKDIETCVLLEMFRFNRLVVDEFSYTEPYELVMYCNINADKRWALSATPRLKDPYDVSRMACFLGLNLPVGASAPGLLSNANMSALRKDMTDLEEFETFRQLPSRTAQKTIHTLAQQFLDTFVRQNVMRSGQYPSVDNLVPITLNADHRLVYTNISQKLNSQDMRIRKGRSREGEFSIMPKVTTAEEALLCIAAVYNPLKRLSTGQVEEDALPGLEGLVKQFGKDHAGVRESLQQSIKICVEKIPSSIKLFSTWVKDIATTNALNDEAVVDEIERMIDAITQQFLDARKSGKKRKLEQVDSGEEEDDALDQEESTGPEDAKKKIGAVSSDAKAYATSTRALRFAKNALKHEKRGQGSSHGLTCDGDGCENKADLHLSANCGHVLCSDCVEISRHRLGTCLAQGCKKDVRSYHLLDLGKLGKSVASNYGNKADELTTLLNRIAAQGEQAILFVQFDLQIDDMIEILVAAEISYHDPRKVKDDLFGAFTGIYGTKKAEKAKKGSKSKKNDKETNKKVQEKNDKETNKEVQEKNEKLPTVLILNSNDVTAAGANLTCANHVIFFSPLLKQTQYEYEAQMAQALGRVRRPGQNRLIQVYRMIALDTIDVDILEHRERRTTVLPQYQDPRSKQTRTGAKFKIDAELAKPQKTQLIRDVNGEYKLVPRQMLLAAGGEGVVAGKDRVLGYEKFNSLIKFSTGFIQDD